MHCNHTLIGRRSFVRDGCFRSDGEPHQRKNFKWDDANIPVSELEWLQADLTACAKPTIVLAHQRLDVPQNHSVKNHAEVRRVLEASEKVLAVFQVHSHDNDLQELNGIHCCTMVAMVEGAEPASSGYSLVSIQPDVQFTSRAFVDNTVINGHLPAPSLHRRTALRAVTPLTPHPFIVARLSEP